MESIWIKTAQLPQFDPLRSDLKTDVLIIGGGLAGVLCACKLTQAGADCALVEAGRIGGGITKNTTAKVTSQHGLIYDRLIREFGTDRARLYLEANQKALEEYRALCRTVDCDFTEKDAFVYSIGKRWKLEREVKALDRLGFKAELTEHIPLPFPVAGAVKFPRQAQLHPLKFIAAIAGDLRIFEHTKVLELAPGKAVTHGGTISADKIIIATHFPILNKHGGYFLKLYQHRSYVLALENAPDVHGMYLDEEEKGLSFRNYGDLLLVGGGSHRTGRQGGCWQELQSFARKHYPDAQEAACWATQDCMTLDGVPYRSLLQRYVRPLCVHRLQQVGDDLLHGSGIGFDRPGAGEKKSLCGAVLPLPDRPPPPAGGKRPGVRPRPSYPHHPPLSPHGLRPEIQHCGAQLGLPLPRLPFHRGRLPHRQPGHRRYPNPL